MAFRRVQYRAGHSPVAHKFFVSERTLERFPDIYKAVDKQSYPSPGTVEFVAPTSPADDLSAVVAPATGANIEGDSHG